MKNDKNNIKGAKKSTCGISYSGKELPENGEELKRRLVERIQELHDKQSVSKFIVDMSMVQGFAAAECILELSQKFPEFSIEAAIPNDSNYSDWEKDIQDYYFELLSECSSKYFIISDTRERYEEMFNRYVSHNASVCINISNNFDHSGSQYVIDVKTLDV